MTPIRPTLLVQCFSAFIIKVLPELSFLWKAMAQAMD
jgi:hypothetical protein